MHSRCRILYLLLPPIMAAIACYLPETGGTRPLKTFAGNWFSTLWMYNAMVSACSILLLLGSSAIGYLPYSDRPGPGWGNIPSHIPQWGEIRYFSGWLVLLLPVSYFLGNILFIFMAWIRWLSVPKWLACALGGLFCAGFTMLAVAAAGWYIAISVAITNSVGICGLFFGAWLLPRVSPQREIPLSLWSRTAGVLLAATSMAAFFIYPFLR
ncbi:MAG TPA: hypothetical protein VE133_04050 [Candidatus Sulfotelmatobacter sp.]|nr:hypothetical protein [Candidatus Sulfotelmatobacter sp.]